ncbi:MAG TPA: efflux RND transporter periplasmic adaptor subunit [Bryobacteraceae bacterium]
MKTFSITAAISLFTLTLSCGSRPQAEAARPESALPGAPPVVAVARAGLADLSKTVVLTAEFHPFQEIEVHAKVAGYVNEILVDVGDRVKAGQTLAVLEVPEMADDVARAAASSQRSEAEVQHAKDELAQAEASHDAAHVTFQRLSDVSKLRPNLIAQQEIDDARAKDLAAEAGISAAKSALAASQHSVQVSQVEQQRTNTMLAYSKITAPFDGVISKRYADTGAMIQAGTSSQSQAMPLVRLSQINKLRLVLPVPEEIVSHIQLGQAVEVRIPSLNHKVVTGSVTRFSDTISTATRTMDTQVDVLNPSLTLVPGMYAEAILTLDRHGKALAIPLTAVSTQGDKSSVLVVNGENKVEERPVKLGIQTANRAEVVAGLHEGDLIVIGSRSQVQPGLSVTPKQVEMAKVNE